MTATIEPRQLSCWVEGFEEYLADCPSPTPFKKWTAISCVAAALQRKVLLRDCLDQQMLMLFPNLFTLLVGPSGVGKTVPMNHGRAFLGEAERIRVAPTRATWERMSEILKESAWQEEGMSVQRLKGLRKQIIPNYTHSSISIFSGEFMVFLGRGDDQLCNNLVQWYDAEDVWDYQTKSCGRDYVLNVWVNLLGATTPKALVKSLPEVVLDHGLGARILFVYSNDNQTTQTVAEYGEEHQKLERMLVHDLNCATALRGAFTVTPELEERYMYWLNNEADQDPWLENIDNIIDGYKSRRHVHLKKLMMILHASKSNTMELELEDFDKALALLIETELETPRSFFSSDPENLGDLTAELVNYVVRKLDRTKESAVLKSELTRVFMGRAKTWNNLNQTFELAMRGGLLLQKTLPRGESCLATGCAEISILPENAPARRCAEMTGFATVFDRRSKDHHSLEQAIPARMPAESLFEIPERNRYRFFLVGDREERRRITHASCN